jgi:hypothetical protein
MDNEIEPTLSPKQLRQQQEIRIADAKNRALEISLDAIAKEFEDRLASGDLASDLKSMKTSALLGNLTRISAAIKQAAVFVVPGNTMPQRDPTALKAQSAIQLSDAQRLLRRKAAEATDAEIVKE